MQEQSNNVQFGTKQHIAEIDAGIAKLTENIDSPTFIEDGLRLVEQLFAASIIQPNIPPDGKFEIMVSLTDAYKDLLAMKEAK